MDEQRAEFEAWATQLHYTLNWREADPPFDEGYDTGATHHAYKGWQAATQRQQERIAELETQVQALSLDAGRYRWIRSNVGDAYMDLATASEDTIDQRIDAEIAAGKGEAS